jgi:hypothetical protein
MATENLEINIGANTQDLQAGLNQASQAVTNFGTQVAKAAKPTGDATNALTNLSRVAQDAPYGFMGIANNLNPLLESFQRLSKETGSAGGALKSMVGGLMGPAGIGVALGVVSSLIVAFGDDINNFFIKLAEGSIDSVRFRDAFKGIGDEFTTAVKKVNDVEIAFAEYHKGILTGEQALKIYNTQLGGNLGIKKNINEAEAVFKAKTTDYIEAQLQRALADSASKKAAEELLKIKQIEATGGEKTSPLVKFFATLPTSGIGADKMFELIDKEKAGKAIATSEEIIRVYKKIAEDAKSASDNIAKNSKINLDPEKLKKPTTKKEDVDISDLETLKKKQQLYKDDVYEYKIYADKITKEEQRVALEKARINKASDNEIKNINEQAAIGLKKNAIDLGNSLDKIFKAADNQYVKNQKEATKEKLATQLQASKDSLDIVKNQLDVETKLAGDDYDKKKEAIKKAMAEIKILMALSSNPKAIQDLDKAYKDMDKNYKILDIDEKQKDAKKLTQQYEKYAEVIATTLTEGFMTMFDAMASGENPLEALGNYVGDLVKKLAEAAIQAAIFQGIMMLLSPTTAGGFGQGFIGGFKKILGMAEGGIVSRPTIAMVGEGGQNEAVMPLNKLGNMMNSTFNAGAMSGTGGGSGQFVLKGNDLVLALQRSNYSLNLRRGNGI